MRAFSDSKEEHERFLQVCSSVEKYIVDTGIQLIGA
jgi:hypothetical protein